MEVSVFLQFELSDLDLLTLVLERLVGALLVLELLVFAGELDLELLHLLLQSFYLGRVGSSGTPLCWNKTHGFVGALDRSTHFLERLRLRQLYALLKSDVVRQEDLSRPQQLLLQLVDQLAQLSYLL